MEHKRTKYNDDNNIQIAITLENQALILHTLARYLNFLLPSSFLYPHRYEEAIEKFNDVIKIKSDRKIAKPSIVKTLLNKVETLFAIKEYNEAEKMYFP